MKYERTIIEDMPKKFDVKRILDFIYRDGTPENPYCIKHGIRIIENKQNDNDETSVVVFRNNLSATGVYILHSRRLKTLTFLVPEFASEADVVLYATLMNAILKKHPRARAFDFSGLPLKYLSNLVIQR